MTPFDEVEKLVKLCFEKKINLIGIDFHNFGFDETLQNKIKNQKELTKKEEKNLNEIIRKREEHHLSKILEYKEKTEQVIVIVGCWHLRKDSLLRISNKLPLLLRNTSFIFSPPNSLPK
jgi:hypothetical protein